MFSFTRFTSALVPLAPGTLRRPGGWCSQLSIAKGNVHFLKSPALASPPRLLARLIARRDIAHPADIRATFDNAVVLRLLESHGTLCCANPPTVMQGEPRTAH